MFSKGEKASALEIVNHPGTKQLYLSIKTLWLMRCTSKSKHRDMQKESKTLFPKWSKGNGCDGRELRGKSSLGRICGAWKHLKLVSCYEPPMMFCHLQWTSVSGLEKILRAPSAHLKHILVGYKVSLTQGRYTWRHNQVLKYLTSSLDSRRVSINTLPTPLCLRAPVKEFVGGRGKGVQSENPRYWPVVWSSWLNAFNWPESEALLKCLPNGPNEPSYFSPSFPIIFVPHPSQEGAIIARESI